MSLTYQDKCEICAGTRGGVPGNENVVESCGERIVMCDYCSADEMQWPGFWKEPIVANGEGFAYFRWHAAYYGSFDMTDWLKPCECRNRWLSNRR